MKTHVGISPADRRRHVEDRRCSPTPGFAWRDSDLSVLQSLLDHDHKRSASMAAVHGDIRRARAIAGWRYWLQDCLRGLAQSAPYGQLSPKARGIIHKAATKYKIEIPQPKQAQPLRAQIPKRPPPPKSDW